MRFGFRVMGYERGLIPNPQPATRNPQPPSNPFLLRESFLLQSQLIFSSSFMSMWQSLPIKGVISTTAGSSPLTSGLTWQSLPIKGVISTRVRAESTALTRPLVAIPSY